MLKPKSILDELPAESTDVESDNIIQRYSKRPKKLQIFCLADYVSKVDVIYPKGNKLPEKVEEKNDDDDNESSSSDENEDSLEDENGAEDSHSSASLYKARNRTRYKKRKVPKIIRYVRHNKKKDLGRMWDLIVSVPDYCLSFYSGKLLQRTAQFLFHGVMKERSISFF